MDNANRAFVVLVATGAAHSGVIRPGLFSGRAEAVRARHPPIASPSRGG